MILSVDAGKPFDKIQINDENSQQNEIEGMFFNIVKAIYDKPKS